jgi:hypothetical protein
MSLVSLFLDWIVYLVQQPTWKLVALLFVNGLWIPVAWWLYQEVWESFQFWTSGMHAGNPSRKFIYLAVDVPSDTEQTPASMEAIFNQLAGAHGTSTWVDQKWRGEFLDWFSFEIVSLEGYVQYIIRCRDNLRDLVEAAVYAQYPDAEISEVSDYTNDVPSHWPDTDWDYFGTGYATKLPDGYPIKTFVEFEDKIRGEFVDPMSAMLEIMSKIGKGEQIWYQIQAKPIVDSDWIPAAQDEIDKLTERYKAPERGGIIGFLMKIPHQVTAAFDSIAETQLVGEGGDDSSNDFAKSPMFNMTPGEKTLLEDMERKTGKLAYKCRIRIAYFGKKNVFSKSRGVGPVVGALKQFNDASKNWLNVEKHSWTKANYAFKKARIYQRQNSFIQALKNRSLFAGDTPGGFILNSEELATIYHFPMLSVKAPMVKRTGAKKSEPPSTLPIGDIGGRSINIGSSPEPPSAGGAIKPSNPVTGEFDSGPIATSNSGSVTDKLRDEKQPEHGLSEVIDASDVQMIEIPEE